MCLYIGIACLGSKLIAYRGYYYAQRTYLSSDTVMPKLIKYVDIRYHLTAIFRKQTNKPIFQHG